MSAPQRSQSTPASTSTGTNKFAEIARQLTEQRARQRALTPVKPPAKSPAAPPTIQSTSRGVPIPITAPAPVSASASTPRPQNARRSKKSKPSPALTPYVDVPPPPVASTSSKPSTPKPPAPVPKSSAVTKPSPVKSAVTQSGDKGKGKEVVAPSAPTTAVEQAEKTKPKKRKAKRRAEADALAAAAAPPVPATATKASVPPPSKAVSAGAADDTTARVQKEKDDGVFQDAKGKKKLAHPTATEQSEAGSTAVAPSAPPKKKSKTSLAPNQELARQLAKMRSDLEEIKTAIFASSKKRRRESTIESDSNDEAPSAPVASTSRVLLQDPTPSLGPPSKKQKQGHVAPDTPNFRPPASAPAPSTFVTTAATTSTSAPSALSLARQQSLAKRVPEILAKLKAAHPDMKFKPKRAYNELDPLSDHDDEDDEHPEADEDEASASSDRRILPLPTTRLTSRFDPLYALRSYFFPPGWFSDFPAPAPAPTPAPAALSPATQAAVTASVDRAFAMVKAAASGSKSTSVKNLSKPPKLPPVQSASAPTPAAVAPSSPQGPAKPATSISLNAVSPYKTLAAPASPRRLTDMNEDSDSVSESAASSRSRPLRKRLGKKEKAELRAQSAALSSPVKAASFVVEAPVPKATAVNGAKPSPERAPKEAPIVVEEGMNIDPAPAEDEIEDSEVERVQAKEQAEEIEEVDELEGATQRDREEALAARLAKPSPEPIESAEPSEAEEESETIVEPDTIDDPETIVEPEPEVNDVPAASRADSPVLEVNDEVDSSTHLSRDASTPPPPPPEPVTEVDKILLPALEINPGTASPTSARTKESSPSSAEDEEELALSLSQHASPAQPSRPLPPPFSINGAIPSLNAPASPSAAPSALPLAPIQEEAVPAVTPPSPPRAAQSPSKPLVVDDTERIGDSDDSSDESSSSDSDSDSDSDNDTQLRPFQSRSVGVRGRRSLGAIAEDVFGKSSAKKRLSLAAPPKPRLSQVFPAYADEDDEEAALKRLMSGSQLSRASEVLDKAEEGDAAEEDDDAKSTFSSVPSRETTPRPVERKPRKSVRVESESEPGSDEERTLFAPASQPVEVEEPAQAISLVPTPAVTVQSASPIKSPKATSPLKLSPKGSPKAKLNGSTTISAIGDLASAEAGDAAHYSLSGIQSSFEAPEAESQYEPIVKDKPLFFEETQSTQTPNGALPHEDNESAKDEESQEATQPATNGRVSPPPSASLRPRRATRSASAVSRSPSPNPTPEPAVISKRTARRSSVAPPAESAKAKTNGGTPRASSSQASRAIPTSSQVAAASGRSSRASSMRSLSQLDAATPQRSQPRRAATQKTASQSSATAAWRGNGKGDSDDSDSSDDDAPISGRKGKGKQVKW
ncbi:hypothetical protein MNV49_003944 [Pseudohyphozyma bogoriensis]|nr:hypothetical protein MNV49_003944 [Pseudohyphozyma bogoriensis]